MKLSLTLRITLLCVGWTTTGALVARAWPSADLRSPWLWLALALLIAGSYLSATILLGPLHALTRAIAGTVSNYRDGDFSTGLAWNHKDAFGELVLAHNQLGEAIRSSRQALVYREVLLDSVVQNSPLATVVLDDQDTILLANILAKQILFDFAAVQGKTLEEVMCCVPAEFREAVKRGSKGMVEIGDGDESERYQLITRELSLNGRDYRLLMVKSMTQILRRQEIQTWKRVIRVMSHELNNSLAPIASLASSGQRLIELQKYAKLSEILAVIGERAQHLHRFLDGYARFARLPQPHKAPCSWPDLVNSLRAQFDFLPVVEGAAATLFVDRAQIEQVLLNLLRNAEESGSAREGIQVRLSESSRHSHLSVLDRGPGMSGEVLEQALLPFYSTKRKGTGLGLALCREIVEAHGGQLSLLNRSPGGLEVRMKLPLAESD